MSPGRRCAVADANGDDRKWRRFLRPRRAAVADDHQQVDRRALPLDERAQPGPHVRAAAAVPELAREARELRDGSRQLRIFHRAGGIDQKTWPWPRLVETRHDELAVAGLPAMRPPVGAVITAERAVAQAPAHRVADGRHVVDLRRERRACPATPTQRNVTSEG